MSAKGKQRIGWIDAWRGLAVAVMLGWHFAWDLGEWKIIPLDAMFSVPVTMIRYFIVCSFVLLSGVSCRLSRGNLRRGTVTLGLGLVISLVTYFLGDPVVFGILHLLGCCMLLYAALAPSVEKCRPARTVMGLMIAFAVLFVITDRVRVTSPWWWILGFRTRAFYSADYYPLLPWALLFFTGAVMGGRLDLAAHAKPARRGCGPLSFLGRHALWIYLIHQPVFCAVLYLATGRFPWA